MTQIKSSRLAITYLHCVFHCKDVLLHTLGSIVALLFVLHTCFSAPQRLPFLLALFRSVAASSRNSMGRDGSTRSIVTREYAGMPPLPSLGGIRVKFCVGVYESQSPMPHITFTCVHQGQSAGLFWRKVSHSDIYVHILYYTIQHWRPNPRHLRQKQHATELQLAIVTP